MKGLYEFSCNAKVLSCFFTLIVSIFIFLITYDFTSYYVLEYCKWVDGFGLITVTPFLIILILGSLGRGVGIVFMFFCELLNPFFKDSHILEDSIKEKNIEYPDTVRGGVLGALSIPDYGTTCFSEESKTECKNCSAPITEGFQSFCRYCGGKL